MQTKYDELSAIIGSHCDDYLSVEYKTLCLRALEKLYRERPSPLTSGRARTWAAGIIYAVAQNNLFDLDVGRQMQVEDGVELLRNKVDKAHRNASETASLLDSLRWLLL